MKLTYFNNCTEQEKALRIAYQCISYAYGDNAIFCYNCGCLCTNKYTLPICEDAEIENSITNVPFCKTCFNNSMMEDRI